jgi:hypothetical protein
MELFLLLTFLASKSFIKREHVPDFCNAAGSGMGDVWDVVGNAGTSPRFGISCKAV